MQGTATYKWPRVTTSQAAIEPHQRTARAVATHKQLVEGKKMAMNTRSESVQKLLQLLQDEFQLPNEVLGFTLHCEVDEIVKIDVSYYPKDLTEENNKG